MEPIEIQVNQRTINDVDIEWDGEKESETVDVPVKKIGRGVGRPIDVLPLHIGVINGVGALKLALEQLIREYVGGIASVEIVDPLDGNNVLVIETVEPTIAELTFATLMGSELDAEMVVAAGGSGLTVFLGTTGDELYQLAVSLLLHITTAVSGVTFEAVAGVGIDMPMTAVYNEGKLTVTLGTDLTGELDDTKNTNALVGAEIDLLPEFNGVGQAEGVLEVTEETPFTQIFAEDNTKNTFRLIADYINEFHPSYQATIIGDDSAVLNNTIPVPFSNDGPPEVWADMTDSNGEKIEFNVGASSAVTIGPIHGFPRFHGGRIKVTPAAVPESGTTSVEIIEG